MKIKQIIEWDVPTDNFDTAQEMVMGEFKDPTDNGPEMTFYECTEGEIR